MTDSHPTDSALAAYVAIGHGASVAVADHIQSCDQCRTIVARLADEVLEDLSDLPGLDDAPAVPPATLRAVADAQPFDPTPDQIWRAAAFEGARQLVWIHRVRADGRVAVVPVTFDTEYADDYSLVVLADRSPLGVDLVFHTLVQTTIDARTLIDCVVEQAGVASDIASVRDARSHGTPASGVSAGSPIVSLSDNRIEYRQQLSDALLELGTARLDPDLSDDDDDHDSPLELPTDSALGALIDDEITAELIDRMLNGLSDTYPAARVQPSRPSRVHADEVSAFATIINIDVFVSIVTVPEAVADEELPELCRAVFQTDLSLHAVCFVTVPETFDARLLDRRSLSDAYETPTGRLRLPDEVLRGSVVDVLLKFFDRRVNPFRALTSATIDPITINHRDLAVQHGADSVRGIADRASGLRVPGKAEGYSRVASHRDAVIRVVEKALTNERIDVAAILDDET